ncbi:hypothetical protein J2S16_004108 [Cytobacillus kochii]|nr:hypothetical protein [Cytobacillus kochii]
MCLKLEKELIYDRNENYLNITDENQYDFATLIYTVIMALLHLLSEKNYYNIFLEVLKKGGSFFLDVFTEHKYNVFTESNNWYFRNNGGFWSPEGYIELNQNLNYDGYTSLEQTTIITIKHPRVLPLFHL